MISYESLEKQELIELLDARDVEIEILSQSIKRLQKDNLRLKQESEKNNENIYVLNNGFETMLFTDWDK